jgi:hypothetical protein
MAIDFKDLTELAKFVLRPRYAFYALFFSLAVVAIPLPNGKLATLRDENVHWFYLSLLFFGTTYIGEMVLWAGQTILDRRRAEANERKRQQFAEEQDRKSQKEAEDLADRRRTENAEQEEQKNKAESMLAMHQQAEIEQHLMTLAPQELYYMARAVFENRTTLYLTPNDFFVGALIEKGLVVKCETEKHDMSSSYVIPIAAWFKRGLQKREHGGVG